MIAKVYSGALCGIESECVEVECDAGTGQYSFVIVGLPDTAVQESRERVRSAIKNSGFHFPRGRVTVNLAPADIRKEGPSFDLPIALSVLFADPDSKCVIPAERQQMMNETVCVGELSLEGQVRAVAGVLPLVLMARARGFRRVCLPVANAREAALVEHIEVIPITTLSHMIEYARGDREGEPLTREEIPIGEEEYDDDMCFIKGQLYAKRALEIAAAGGHHMLLWGPPGSGKTLLARTLPSLLPRLSDEEALEVSCIYSACGMLDSGAIARRIRPFRSPHHTASAPAIVGGGSAVRPGEITLAHKGVLFLDELPEFSRSVLESLRQPLEDGCISVSRASGSVRFPAECQIIATQNPCPCGYYGEVSQKCSCSIAAVLKYQKRISGPLLDRIDLHVEVGALEVSDMTDGVSGEASREIRARVEHARSRQAERFRNRSFNCNANMRVRDIEKQCSLSGEVRDFLKGACSQFHLSGRAYSRVLKVARTIADLEGGDQISVSHCAESMQYRVKGVTTF